MFYCEFCKVFKNTYFEEHLRTGCFSFLHRTCPLAASAQQQLSGGVYRLAVLKNFSKFTNKHLKWSSFLVKLTSLGLIFCCKNVFHCNYFPVDFVKLFRATFCRISWYELKYHSLEFQTQLLTSISTDELLQRFRKKRFQQYFQSRF